MFVTPTPPRPEPIRTELETLMDQIREDQPRMVQYKMHERIFRCSLEVLRAAEIEAHRRHLPVNPVLRAEVRRAYEAWERQGYRVEIDGILERIRLLSRSVELH